jgi:alpha-1,3-mannosyltransferase
MDFLRTICHKLAHHAYDIPYLALLLVAEAILTTLIVLRVPYTEIDWVAYMQEVTTYQAGERDYVNIRGDTGPLVYPAGFLYLYGWLKSLAVSGSGSTLDHSADLLVLDGSTSAESIRRIQWVFCVFYLLNSVIVLSLYQSVLLRIRQTHDINQQPSRKTIAVWSWRIAMGITCLSKRLHSIFVLRLFNDAPAIMMLHLSMFLFACCDAWSLGCVVFSLAVSIKMNILLFAPGLLLLLLQKNQSILGTIKHLSTCALVQLIIGWPFISTYPVSYIKKAFEFDRVFFYKWTVNWKFLPEELFVSKIWASLLLICHLGTLVLLVIKWCSASNKQRGAAKTREWMCWRKSSRDNLQLSPEYIIYTMFVSNYVGIAFARTLHYQFYCWYYLSLPTMHWMTMGPMATTISLQATIHVASSLIAIFGNEVAFNVFPATWLSSIVLQLSHAFLLIKIFLTEVPSIVLADDDNKRKDS